MYVKFIYGSEWWEPWYFKNLPPRIRDIQKASVGSEGTKPALCGL